MRITFEDTGERRYPKDHEHYMLLVDGVPELCVFNAEDYDGEDWGGKPEDFAILRMAWPREQGVATCQNCGRKWLDGHLVNPIPHLHERVAAGEPMPSGECPTCGALCHPEVEADAKV